MKFSCIQLIKRTCGGGAMFLSHLDPSGASGAARRKEWKEEVERERERENQIMFVSCTRMHSKLS